MSMGVNHVTGSDGTDIYDAIIVGGGFAGLTAAREMRYRGLRPIVLEARDRLGGRTFPAQLGGEPVEMGGQSVHWSQTHLWAELTRYGIGIVENPPWEVFVMWNGPTPHRYTRAEAGQRLVRLFDAFFEGIGTAITRPFDPLFNREAIGRLDRLTIKDRLDELDLSADDRAWFEEFLAIISGWPIDQAGLAAFVWTWALGSWSLPRMLEGMGRYSLEGGTVRLLSAIADDMPFDIRLKTPVTRIDDSGDDVIVTVADSTSFRGRCCIVATPVGVWPIIEFASGIATDKLAAAREGVVAPVFTKIWVLADGKVDSAMAVFPPGRPISQLRVNRRRDDGLYEVVAFSIDSGFDPADHAAIRQAVEEVLPGVDIREILTEPWHHEPYSNGAFGWMRPGQLVRYYDELRRPEGRLYFATSDIADGPGGMGGAIESGMRASRMALEALASCRQEGRSVRPAMQSREK